MQYRLFHGAFLTVFLIPFVVFAQTGPQQGFGAIGQTVQAVLGFINGYLTPTVFGIAFIVFLWGLFKYFIYGGANEDSQEKGKQLAVWGILGFVIMVSIWGLVNVLASSLGFDRGQAPILPVVPGAGGTSQQQSSGSSAPSPIPVPPAPPIPASPTGPGSTGLLF